MSMSFHTAAAFKGPLSITYAYTNTLIHKFVKVTVSSVLPSSLSLFATSSPLRWLPSTYEPCAVSVAGQSRSARVQAVAAERLQLPRGQPPMAARARRTGSWPAPCWCAWRSIALPRCAGSPAAQLTTCSMQLRGPAQEASWLAALLFAHGRSQGAGVPPPPRATSNTAKGSGVRSDGSRGQEPARRTYESLRRGVALAACHGTRSGSCCDCRS